MSTNPTPRWRCHKEVSAFKVDKINPDTITGEWVLESADGHRAVVSGPWVTKHTPKLGGYYVVYDDGYASFSPARAFEDGYSRIIE